MCSEYVDFHRTDEVPKAPELLILTKKTSEKNMADDKGAIEVIKGHESLLIVQCEGRHSPSAIFLSK